MGAFAEQQAGAWKEGLGGWGITPERLRSCARKVESRSTRPARRPARPMNIVGDLNRPPGDTDPEVVSDEIDGYVTSLLGMLGVSGRPAIIARAHPAGQPDPERVVAGAETSTSARCSRRCSSRRCASWACSSSTRSSRANDRMAFAMRLNGLLASPSFAAWLTGDPIDIDAMLRTPEGKPALRDHVTAHLSDEQRQSVTSLVLASS